MVNSKYLVSIQCDCCKKDFIDELEIQEFLRINEIGGYSSAIGDEVHYQCDLCSACVKRLLGKYLRIIPRDWEERQNAQNRL